MTRNIRVGAVDWRKPAWAGGFYPADLPEDWQLTFYSSQFNCVYLPASAWQGASPAELAQWREDAHSRFVFLLEAVPGQAMPQALADKVLAVTREDGRIVWFDRASDLKALAARLNDGDPLQDLYLISRDGDLGQMERVGTLLELMGF